MCVNEVLFSEFLNVLVKYCLVTSVHVSEELLRDFLCVLMKYCLASFCA